MNGVLVAGFAVAAALTAAVSGGVDCEAQQSRVAEAVDEVGVAVPDGWTVATTCVTGGEVLGRAHGPAKVISIWAAMLPDDGALRHVVAHEIGHAYDREYLTELDRIDWQKIAMQDERLPLPPWRVCYEDECQPPSEAFADTFARCHLRFPDDNDEACSLLERMTSSSESAAS